MGKKGKGNKLAKMSEDERARYLQMRADIEEEARRRKQQLISLYIKNKLKREDAFCRLNMAKINQEWRTILRQSKCDDLREEMIELKRCFKEALECKERVIQRLLNDLDVAEDMYATLEQSHMETVDKLIGIHQQRMNYLKESYERERASIMTEYDEDFDGFKRMRARAQEELECVMYQLEDKNSKELLSQHEKYLECLDDARSAIRFRLEKITQNGEEKLERLWQEYQDVLSTYVKNTETFYAEYMDLKEREEENKILIRDHYREIENSSDQLSHLKLSYVDLSEKCEAKIEYLSNIKNELYIKLTLRKDEAETEIKNDAAQFKLMAVTSYQGVKHFEGILKKGETILQLFMVCRKYETEREKILPWSLPPVARKAFEDNDDDELINLLTDGKDSTLDSWYLMEKFWKRVNSATIDVVSLKQEKRKLEQENQRLKIMLQEYLIELNISNGSNLHVNDYLNKRPSSMRVDRVARITPEPTRLKSHSARACDAHFNRRRLCGRGGVIVDNTTNANANANANNDSIKDHNGYRRRPFTNITDANLTNAVRSKRLVRGKPRLAKIESFVNWIEIRRHGLTV